MSEPSQIIRFIVHGRNNNINNETLNIPPLLTNYNNNLHRQNIIIRNNISEQDRNITGIFMLLNYINNHINNELIIEDDEIPLFHRITNFEETNLLTHTETRAHERQNDINIEIPKFTYKDIPESEGCTQCPICMTKFNPNTKISLTDCEHIFCYDCLKEWCHYNPNCPVCRKNIA
tara:strand:- start:6433 stop:6960 length:528 start_codon:yes stop_codon:yes gene_type:complete